VVATLKYFNRNLPQKGLEKFIYLLYILGKKEHNVSSNRGTSGEGCQFGAQTYEGMLKTKKPNCQ